MNRTLMQHTQIAVVLSINVYRRTGQGETLQPLHLLALTPLLMWLFTLLRQADGWLIAANDWLVRAVAAVDLTARLAAIMINSLAFAVGVTQ